MCMEKKNRPLYGQKLSVRSTRSRVQSKGTQRSKRPPARQANSKYRYRYRDVPEFEGLFDKQGKSGAKRETAYSAALGTPNAGATVSGFSFLRSFGGFDGIMSIMTRVQQVFRLFQQMGPMFKLFGFMGGGAKATTASIRPHRDAVPVMGGKYNHRLQAKR
jgi:hypothetical protein